MVKKVRIWAIAAQHTIFPLQTFSIVSAVLSCPMEGLFVIEKYPRATVMESTSDNHTGADPGFWSGGPAEF